MKVRWKGFERELEEGTGKLVHIADLMSLKTMVAEGSNEQ